MRALTRAQRLDRLQNEEWEVLIIGGGITGAGILLACAEQGIRAALIEQRDFAYGTSSRSSKLVHGGLRYLKQGHFKLTRDSAREREALLRELPGLVKELPFAFPFYPETRPSRWVMGIGMTLYDALAGICTHRWNNADELHARLPSLRAEDLRGGYVYRDAVVDDARLVLRVLSEAEARSDAVMCVNDVAALNIVSGLREVEGVDARDALDGSEFEVNAKVVINATGAWADAMRVAMRQKKRLRPLRGSHLVFKSERLPMAFAAGLPHPRDRRPVFVYPWEGATVVGTTDLDHFEDLAHEPRMAAIEADYLFELIEHYFPTRGLTRHDVISSFAGVRPVIGTGAKNPSDESRDHVIWMENGLLTVTGGKLTTFRLIARDVMQRVCTRLQRAPRNTLTRFASSDPEHGVTSEAFARHGQQAQAVQQSLDAASRARCRVLGLDPVLASELAYALQHEQVNHWDDLLLRRVRLALTHPEQMHGVAHALLELGVVNADDPRFNEGALERFGALWQSHYAPPGG